MKRCKKSLQDANETATKAVENAEAAANLTRNCQTREDDCKEQRDDYRGQRDEARVERDHLAGELAASKTRINDLEVKIHPLIVENSILDATVANLRTSRWYWLAGGFALGVGAIIGASVVLK